MKVRNFYTHLFGILFLTCVALFFGAGAEDAVAQQQISPQGLQQMQALLEEKVNRTPIQRKISSHLLHALKMRQREPIARGIPTLRSSVDVAADGSTLVDIKADVTEALLDHIVVLGGTIINSFPQYRAVRAQIPLLQIEAIASFPEVQSIRPADQAVTNTRRRLEIVPPSLYRKLTSLPGLRLGFVTPSIGVQTQTRDPLLKFAQAWTGNLFDTPITNKINTSQGDIAHRAALARSTFGVNGTGIRIGVMSDSVDALANLQASGDLPAVTVLSGQSGVPGTSEGTAMLEIVHDLAPGAQLFFATANGGEPAFASNILALRNAGCDIIVDDIFYFAEAVFQDDIVAQAVNTVTVNGALYFSSAGNSGNKNDGTSGVWEGDFVAAGSLSGVDGTVHNFGGGNVGNVITVDSSSFFTFHWSDPVGASSNDYDLYLMNSTLTGVVAASNNFQDGNDDPFEFIDSRSLNHTNLRLVIVKFSGADRYLHLNANRGRLQINTAGQTSGHAAAVNAFGVAAVDVATASGGSFVGGATNPVETFSSDGPRRIFYNANGSPITPGNFLSTGGTVRQKPDIAAADGVATATPGFNPFFGTSAAAPHAAAIAALVLDANLLLIPATVRSILTGTALDIEASGVDRDSGHGLLDAFAAVQTAISAPPDPITPLAIFRPSLGRWFVDANRNGTTDVAVTYGVSSDIPVPGDYDGNEGLIDFAVFRPGQGRWFIDTDRNGTTNLSAIYGTAGDIPVPGDYNGDGRTDFAVFRPSQGRWFIDTNRNGLTDIAVNYGTRGDIPVPADYNGDAITDIAVFRPSQGRWFVDTDRNGTTNLSVAYGANGDIPLPADYNGDGAADLAVFRRSLGRWFLDTNRNGLTDIAVNYGASTDIPVPGDYNGDLMADIAVFRPSQGRWFLDTNRNGATDKAVNYGTAGDIPLRVNGWILKAMGILPQ